MGYFAELAVSSQALITKLGRPVVLRQDVGATDVDPAQPWLGSTASFSDVSAPAVFDVFTSSEKQHTEVQENDVKGFMSSLDLGAVVPKPGDLIIDGAQTMRVMSSLHYKPNVDSIAFELHLRPA
jgi:hypothetical protein